MNLKPTDIDLGSAVGKSPGLPVIKESGIGELAGVIDRVGSIVKEIRGMFDVLYPGSPASGQVNPNWSVMANDPLKRTPWGPPGPASAPASLPEPLQAPRGELKQFANVLVLILDNLAADGKGEVPIGKIISRIPLSVNQVKAEVEKLKSVL